MDGLLATVSGSVSCIASDGGYIYVDDGSHAQDASGNQGIRVPTDKVWSSKWSLSKGSGVSVTGSIGLVYDSAAGSLPCIRPRYTSDVATSFVSLTGSVTDSVTSAGIVGAEITVLGSAGNVVASGSANSAGAYTLGMPVGTYTVTSPPAATPRPPRKT